MKEIGSLEVNFPDLKASRDWAIIVEVLRLLAPQVFEVRHAAERSIAARERPVQLLAVNDERISLDELYTAFNDSLPVWVVALALKDDKNPIDFPARKCREEINRGVTERGLDRPLSLRS